MRRLARPDLARLLLVQLLMVVLTYAPLFWGIRHVPSGLTAVLDLALMPVSLLGFGIALGEDSWSLARAAALGFGFAGLRADSYAYLSPVIAVLLGVLALGEKVGLRDGFGMGLLLVAAFCSLRASRSPTQQHAVSANYHRQVVQRCQGWKADKARLSPPRRVERISAGGLDRR